MNTPNSQREDGIREKENSSQHITKMSEGVRGWYDINIQYSENDFLNGGHKKRWLNSRVIADNPLDAYRKGCAEIEKAEGFFIEDATQALIEYVGLPSDEYLMKND